MTTTTTTASTEPAPQPDQTPRPPTVIANPPRPQASTPNARWRIFKDPSGAGCQSQPVAKCPPNTACNPPRPQPYTCPTDMQLDTLGSVTIVSSADGMSCSVDYGQINCPKGAACNPPPPRSVTCPKQ